MKPAVIVFWKKFNWLDSQEIEDLVQARKFKIIDIITFKGDKPNQKHFVPLAKVEEIKALSLNHENLVIVIDGNIRPYQIVELENMTGITVIDKTMLVLDIFREKASSKDVQLQIDLAELTYKLPQYQSQISQNLESERQARDRGSGEQLKDITKSNINNRISRMRKQLEEIRIKQQKSQKTDEVIKIPIIGFYSAGKSTIFNILTNANQEINSEAFTTMIVKTSRSDVFGYPIDFVDTVGLVDLPDNILNSFNLLLEPLFDSKIIIITLDSSLLRDHWLHQLDHVRQVVQRFKNDTSDDLWRFIIIHSKIDLTENSEIFEKRKIISQQDWLKSYIEIESSSKKPEILIEELKLALEKLFEDLYEEFYLENVPASHLSKIYDLSRVDDVVWNEDGTCNIKGSTYDNLYGQIQKLLGVE
jgi:GTPase